MPRTEKRSRASMQPNQTEVYLMYTLMLKNYSSYSFVYFGTHPSVLSVSHYLPIYVYSMPPTMPELLFGSNFPSAVLADYAGCRRWRQ